MKRKLIKFVVAFVFLQNLFSQTLPQLEFNNQKITDVLLVLADLGKCSIIPDETVSGNVSFFFSGGDFEVSLKNFLSSYDLWYTKENNIFYVSKINVQKNDNNLLTIDAEDVDLTLLVKTISKKLNKTIVYDALPRGDISIHAVDVNLATVLEMLIRKNWEYELIEENDYFYIQKSVSTTNNNSKRYSKVLINKKDNLYSLDAPRVAFTDLVTQLFEKANKEHLILMKTSLVLENLSYKDKSFEQILRLVLNLASADFVLKDDIYYIFETQKNGIIKKLHNTETIKLNNISVQHAITLIPIGYDTASLIKVDKNTNTIYLTGTSEEIKPIKKFLEEIDKPLLGKSYERFDVHYGDVANIVQLIPSELIKDSITIIPESNSFIALVSPEISTKIKEHLKLLDKSNTGIPVRLKYIKNEDLLKYLPPTIVKEDLIVSSDDTLVFYVGAEGKYNTFIENLKLIDVPKPQIRYELLIVQYQKGTSENFSKSLSVKPVTEEQSPSFAVAGMISNLLNINFDVVSKFGYQFAVNLSQEIGESRAKVLADTTLHGISGTDVKFQNTNTYRYNEGVLEDNSSVIVKTSTKEITSGLQLTINGWVSGDGMITMKVNAEVSKQGTVTNSTNNLPPTSEKIVTSEVRTKSGEPIIIGGLLQTELTENIKKVPLLGSIPIIGGLFQDKNIIEETSEMAIYIVPHTYIQEGESIVESRNIEKYYTTFVLEE